MEIAYGPEVSDALAAGRPVVALESTVIAHGLPHPLNIETALRCEAAVRESGAVPATIAILEGVFRAGLTYGQIEHMADPKVIRKASIRDLSIAAAVRMDCATTVAATAFIAYRAGVKVFATGGVGGVHRGYAADVSADLPILAATPITVVCSGAKMVLDIAATREWLETHGVAVLGWQCDEMPVFYSRTSGQSIDQRVDSAAEAASIAAARDTLGLRQATLLTVPVPEGSELPYDEMEMGIKQALQKAEEFGIAGKDVTPFLLSELTQISNGRTLKANAALLENNARIGGLVACEISKLAR